MAKIFENFEWKDSPDESTPIEAENLQKLNDAIDKIDTKTQIIDENGDVIDELKNKTQSINTDGTEATFDKFFVGSPPKEVIPPADYVVEQGNNYTKWNGGRFEQWGNFEDNTRPTIAYGAAYRTNPLTATFPLPFLTGTSPWFMVQARDYTLISLQTSTATTFSYTKMSMDNNIRTGTPLSFYAIGRWK